MTIALYIHVPFCVRKCLYCDFVSRPFSPGAAEAYLDGLFKESRLYGSSLPDEEKEISSLYVGGGTPTCLPAAFLKRLLENVRSIFHFLPGAEVTVEANPGTIEPGKLDVLRETGANRLSLGIQSFRDDLLGALGRVHSAGEALEAVRLAREAGFTNLNLDFIFGIPGQSLDHWRETLDIAVCLAPVHIALYGLQLEEGTPLEHAVSRGELKACPEELELTMYQLAIEFLKTHGYSHYEISNFTRPGRESVHNSNYWLNRPFLGLGPAAHSYLGGRRFANHPSLEKYCEKLFRGEYPLETAETILPETEMSETMFLGLRLLKGVDLGRFQRRFGRRAEDVYREQIARLAEAGLVEVALGYLRLTEKGLPLANRVFRAFV